MEWILDKLPVIIFVLVFLGQAVRGFLKMRGAREAEPPVRNNEFEEHRRAQEIQAEIRRKIAERRAGRAPSTAEEPPARQEEPAPPVMTPRDPTAIPSMPEPLRRMLEQLERRTQPAPMAVPPPVVERRAAELERQERLAEELRVLEETRTSIARRAANVAAAKAELSRSEGPMRTLARGRLMEDLSDPESLRRAFVLREVLGPPVGLR